MHTKAQLLNHLDEAFKMGGKFQFIRHAFKSQVLEGAQFTGDQMTTIADTLEVLFYKYSQPNPLEVLPISALANQFAIGNKLSLDKKPF